MSAKKFNTPFAILGDKVEVPTTAQIDGSVSFEQGYPFGYEADYTDPNSKDISRSKTNQLLFDITDAIREIQQGGVSEWSAEGKPYKINSLVYAPDGTVKQSLIANNNNDTTHSSWSNVINASTLATILANEQVVRLSGNQTIAGVKTFSSSPIVPTPTTGTQAVNKDYADLKVALASFIGSNQSLSDTGYQNFPGGLIIQWGKSPSQLSVGENIAVSLPIAFPNVFLRGYAFYDADTSLQCTYNVGMLNLSQIKIYNTHPTNGSTPSYIAIGY